MQRPTTIASACVRCRGTGKVQVRTAGGMEKKTCPACRGLGQNGYRTK